MDECEQCCGFGGTFAIKFGDVSAAIADRKCAAIEASGAGAVVLGDLGCMLNIEGRLRRRGNETVKVLHVAEVLRGRARLREPLMHVQSMHFKARAAGALADDVLQANLRKFGASGFALSAREGGRGVRRGRLRAPARRRRGDPRSRARDARRLHRTLRAQGARAAARPCSWPRRGEACDARARDRRAPRREEGGQVEVDAVRGSRAERRASRPPASSRWRPTSASTSSSSPASRRRTSSRRRSTRRATRSPTCSRRSTSAPRKTDIARADARGARQCCAAIFCGRHGHLRRELPDRRDGLGAHRDQRGQRPDGDHAAARARRASPASRRSCRRSRTSRRCCGSSRARRPGSRSRTT